MLLFAKQHEMCRASVLEAANTPWEWADRCYNRLVDELVSGENDPNPASCLVCVGCHCQSIWILSREAKIIELETDGLWIAMVTISGTRCFTERCHAAAVFWLAQVTVTCCSGWRVCPVMGCESLWKLQVKERCTWISNKQPHSFSFERCDLNPKRWNIEWVFGVRTVCFRFKFHPSLNIAVCFVLFIVWISLHQYKEKGFLSCCWQPTADCADTTVAAELGVSRRAA